MTTHHHPQSKKPTQSVDTLWGFAANAVPASSMVAFTAGRDVYGSAPIDQILIPYELWGSAAHCIMLATQKIISKDDAKYILEGLQKIKQLWKHGAFLLDPKKEDVHTNVEAWLTGQYGIDIAGTLHTGRSRNDQNALNVMLYTRDQAVAFLGKMIALIEELGRVAHEHQHTVMPGFTHYRHATPTSFGHVLLGFASMLARDGDQFAHWIKQHAASPLGAAASYGTSVPIEPEYTAVLLGFDGIAPHSMDAVMNQWEFEADFLYAVSMLMNHLATIAYTLTLFSMPEFGYIALNDRHTTGSSIMPQKHNPDVLETVQAKADIAAGALQSIMNIGKGSFIGYSRKTQWSKCLTVETAEGCIAAPGMIKSVIHGMSIDVVRMTACAHTHFVGTTHIIEKLVSNCHVPMRKAKTIVEHAIAASLGTNTLTHHDLIKAARHVGEDISVTKKDIEHWQDPIAILHAIQSSGGPGDNSMATMERSIHDTVAAQKAVVTATIRRTNAAKAALTEKSLSVIHL